MSYSNQRAAIFILQGLHYSSGLHRPCLSYKPTNPGNRITLDLLFLFDIANDHTLLASLLISVASHILYICNIVSGSVAL